MSIVSGGDKIRAKSGRRNLIPDPSPCATDLSMGDEADFLKIAVDADPFKVPILSGSKWCDTPPPDVDRHDTSGN